MKREIFNEALKSIKGNHLRTILTISIIAVGITSLVGTLTAARGVEEELRRSFGKMGLSTFYLTADLRNGDGAVTFFQTEQFKKFYHPGATVVAYAVADPGGEGVSYEGNMASEDVRVIAADGGFVDICGGNVGAGRGLSGTDEGSTCLIGARVAKMIFRNGPDAVGKSLHIGGAICTVTGVLDEMGSGSGSLDNAVILPVKVARSTILTGEESFAIGVMPMDGTIVEEAMDEAVMVMRSVRRLGVGEENDFQVRRRDLMASRMGNTMKMVTLAAFALGVVTLMGASVGLMNIMLVSVKERTREIGVRKALGASDREIGALFLCEAVIIGGIGGVAGVVLGLVAGGVVSAVMETPFGIPWGWVGVSLMVSMAVCLISGSLPARRAAALPPVEALRGE